MKKPGATKITRDSNACSAKSIALSKAKARLAARHRGVNPGAAVVEP
jgi:hypothetical protein